MPDRTIVWGDPADAGTKYRTQDDDPAGGGNFVVAEDTDGNTVLLQWNPDAGTAGQWEYSGPVDLGGNDLTSVGTATVDALEAGRIDISDRILQSGDAIGPGVTTGAVDNIDNVTSTTYTFVAGANGLIDGSRVPPGASLYANLSARLDNGTNGETITITPILSGVAELTSIELTKTSTSDTVDLTTEQTGWTEVAESISGLSEIVGFNAKVSGGKGNFSGNQAFVSFEWRID